MSILIAGLVLFLGMHSLRIVDSSLFPVIPSANVHLTVLMVAEKIADDILAQASS